MTQKEFRMDVIIPHLNYDGLRKSLVSLRKYTPSENIGRVILIDQSKEYQKVDDLIDWHIFTNGKNLGFAKSMNMGIRLSDMEFVLCLNDDVEFINKKWVDGVVETFNRYETTALGVNPSSPRNPRASGDIPVYAPGWDYKEEYTEEEYDRMLSEIGKGHVIDGICTFATIFRRSILDKVAGIIPGKCWFDEYFHSGGEDYDLNRRGYLTKNEDNNLRGYRMLGTGLSFVIHHWYSTKNEKGIAAVKHCGNKWADKWGTTENGGNVDLYGRTGNPLVPPNKIRTLEECNL